MRFVALWLSLAGVVGFAAATRWSDAFYWPALLCGGLAALGLWDMLQQRHSLRRNYPILANLRFMLETVRPEIRQY